MVVQLPARSSSGPRRSRGGRAPTAADVPTQQSGRDPGLNVPGLRIPGVRVPGVRVPQGDPVGAALVNFGDTVASVAAELARVSEQTRAANRRAAVAAKSARASVEARALVFDLSQDPDFESYPERFQEGAAAIAAKHSEGLDDEGQQAPAISFIFA